MKSLLIALSTEVNEKTDHGIDINACLRSSNCNGLVPNFTTAMGIENFAGEINHSPKGFKLIAQTMYDRCNWTVKNSSSIYNDEITSRKSEKGRSILSLKWMNTLVTVRMHH